MSCNRPLTHTALAARLGVGLVVLVAVGLTLLGVGTGRAASCETSGPAGGAYTVQVCIAAPAEGATVVGPTDVSVTASVQGTSSGVQRAVFYLDGQYLLTDYQSPYTFTLPSDRFVDGTKLLEVEVLMRGDGFVSTRASVSLTFSNGVTTPPTNTNAFTPRTATPPPGQPLVVAAAGDGAGGEQSEHDVTDLIASWNPQLFLYLGDVYEKGSGTEFYNWYRSPNGALPTAGYYGRFAGITNPTIGNHEYTAGQAPGYFDYWDNVPHYYSFDSNGWHFVSLDANGAFNETAPGTPQYQWLESDLEANSQPCTLVYYHQPVWNIGEEPPATNMSSIWALLAQHGVDLVVNGHDHTYQRWQPLDGAGNPSPTGVTELVAGTGGHAQGAFVRSDSRVAASATEFGALRLELNGGGAVYQFVTTGGQTLDSGSVACGSGDDTTPPSPPTSLTATGSYKTRIDLSWAASTDDVGVTGYEIFRDGQSLLTVGPQTSYADETVQPGTTHTYAVRAIDAAGNRSGFSADATATTPTVAVLFRDGFESGALSSWINPAPTSNPANNGLVAQQAQAFAGSWGAEATSTGLGASAWKALEQPEPELYYVVRFKVLSQGANVNLLRFRNNAVGANAIATVFVTTTDKIGLRNDVVGASTTSSAVAARGSWHTLQAHVVVNGTSGSTEVWLDGTPVPALSQSSLNLGTAPIGRLELGDTNSATSPKSFDVAFDEVAYDREAIGDITPPSAASSLIATARSGLEVDLSWTAGADDVAVVGYDVYRNGSLLASIPAGTSYADKTVVPLTSYTYTLVAKDAAGNVSSPSNAASVTTGDAFADTFESGDLSKWTTVAGLTVQQGAVDGGQWAAEAVSTGASGSSAQVQLDSTLNELYYRARFKRISQGSNSVSLVRVRDATNGAIASVFLASNGKVGYRNDVSSTTVTSGVTATSGVWHEIQLHVLVAGATSQVDVWLDGVRAISQADALGTAPVGRLELGDPAAGRTFDIAFDNVLADATFISDTVAPSAPSNVRSTGVTASTVDLAWDAGTDDVGVTGYRIYRGGANVGQVDGDTLAYTDSGLTEATTYSYTVTSVDAAGHESAPSGVAQATTTDASKPTKPSSLTATAVPGANRIDLTWGASTDNVAVTEYRIWRDGGATPVATVPGSSTSYSDTTVASSTAYTYTVTARDADLNESDHSDPATATSSDTVSPLPPTVTAVAVSDVRIDLSWSGASDDVAVAGYQVFRNGGATPVATVSAPTTAYSDAGLAPDTQYTYTVKAVDAAANVSAASAPASATTFVFADGFETGNLSRWSGAASFSVQSANVLGGTWGGRATSNGNKGVVSYAYKQLGTTQANLYYDVHFKILSGKPSTVDVMRFDTASGGSILALYYDSKRKLGVQNSITNKSTASTTTLSTGVWYDARVHVSINGTTSQIEVWLNGTRITALSRTDSLGTTPVGRIEIGESVAGRSYDVAYDDIVVTKAP